MVNKEKVFKISKKETKKRDYNTVILSRYKTKEGLRKIFYQGYRVKSYIDIIMSYNSSEVSILNYLNPSSVDKFNQTSIDQISKLSKAKALTCLNTCILFYRNTVLGIDTKAIIKILLEILSKLDIIESKVKKKIDELKLGVKCHSKQSKKYNTELQYLTNSQLHNSMLLRYILDMDSLTPSSFNNLNFYKNNIVQYMPDNDVIVEHVTDCATRQYINKMFNFNNRYSNSIRIKNVFKVHLAAHNKRFKQKLFFIGNKQIAWHGTEKKNIASILTRGLLLPGERSENYELNYGQGIYFSSSASKSLCYCKDWIDKSSLHPTTNYLIFASVAVGKHCVPTKNGPFPTIGFDSIWAHKLDRYYRDELVVYSEDQVRIDYIVEVEKYKH